MKIQFIIILLIFLSLLSCKSTNYKNENKYLCKQEQILVDRLKIIKSYIDDTTFVKFGEMHNSAFFLVTLTGIETPSWDGFIDSYNPTLNDYNSWYKWYQTRKDSICNDFYKRRIDSIYKIAH